MLRNVAGPDPSLADRPRPDAGTSAGRAGGRARRRRDAERRGAGRRARCALAAPLHSARRRSSPRSGYGGYLAYDWFVEGRFLVSTDDAYVGADTAIIAAKVAGHVAEVAVGDNAFVHAGDLLVRIDDGDYRSRSRPPRTRSRRRTRRSRASAGRSRRKRAVIAQAAGAGRLRRARNCTAPRPTSSAPRSNSTARRNSRQTNFGSQQRLEQATADRARTAAALAGGERRQSRGRSGARRRQGQSRSAEGSAGRGRAHARRTRHRRGKGRARPLLHRNSRAVRRRRRQQGGRARRNTRCRARGCWRWCR